MSDPKVSNYSEAGPTIRDFVFQDAIERAFQISIKGIKEFEQEKKNLYRERKEVVSDEFERRNKEKLVEKRIHRSALINKSRMSKMEARNNAIMKVVSIAQHKLLNSIINNPTEYKQLLKNLIVEGLITLFESEVTVRCLERDVSLVEAVVADAKREYEQKVKSTLDQEFPVNIKVNRGQYLTLRVLQDSDKVPVSEYTSQLSKQQMITKSDEDNKCFGGVILTAHEGKIVCKNTLDIRIDLAFSNLLPVIRQSLFPN